ncbi:MAG: HlyD family type I secretion periplasmic adaptor subunit [Alphaproteobacteria bacterium]|nr:HlyD family type I secretion periplasmic adaptor subunit [Alphaproteobacteria bacterium]MBU1514481.1 HlyD family type I secretion periplasmic adaptor subunit [Alphaproteobacteria bacterium]MBU2096887.1 HlyD family type I secretion periplasmic adaptor subunit [Alphaproteobacteria bacterium]MBU2153514.1 HlyD family type I secretion periplasmic adaptor subunit [Alphaproteobacteria bacterium]MBU2305981.1 HlyD family type I secretion periplasmic adaptor subunit [Alphaproteobacteria bacterium]
MLVGGGIIGAFVIGLGLWASVSQLSTGITAQAEVRADAMRKTMRHKEVGVVKAILVQEGQHVRAGQPLLLFNDVEARAAVSVMQNQYDTFLSQNARFTAEALGRPSMEVPPELAARLSDPAVATLVRDQQFVFMTRQQLFQSQGAVLQQRIEQQETQVVGQQAQVDSILEQQRLTEEELDGYRKLNEQGFAPKTLILRYERTLAELAGRKGQLVADIARLKQQMGETRLQLTSIRNERESQAAEGLRDSQAKLADIIPRLTTARQTLDSTVVRSPVDGYVFNLTQFTVGGLVGGGEVMMDVVPSGTPLTVTAMIKPEDVDEVHKGMKARVKLTGLNQRFNDALDATVDVVSADKITNEKTGVSFYRVDLRIAPVELKKLKKGVQMTPGMPAQALIVTGERSVMSFLISPITATMEDAFREE